MITILCGKSGCGKDTMFARIIKDNIAKPIISTTSRPIREKEKQGREYNFVTKKKFLEMIDQKKFMEFRSYETEVNGTKDTWYYGSTFVDPKAADYVIVLDINGARSYINTYGKKNCTVIMLTVPDNIREDRARKRGSFDQIEWDRRLADDNIKFSDTATRGIVDLTIENIDDPAKTYNKIKQYINTKQGSDHA